MARQKYTAARIATEERRRLALELRKAGASFEQIGKSLGIRRQSAHELVVKALAEVRAKTTEEAETVKTLELLRLDDLLRGLWPAASKGNPQAVEKCLKVMERRAHMLGSDAPTKIAPTSPDGQAPYKPMNDTELDARIRELASKLGAEAAPVHGAG